MDEKLLCSFHADCGRMGHLNGLFIAYRSDVNRLIGTEVYFGEVLGKHSEIVGVIEEDEITIVSNDREKIDWLREVIGSDTISGHNPFDYIEEE